MGNTSTEYGEVPGKKYVLIRRFPDIKRDKRVNQQTIHKER